MTVQDVSLQLAHAKAVYKRTLARCDAHLKGIIGRDPSMMAAAKALQAEYATDLDGAVLIAFVQPPGKEPEPVPSVSKLTADVKEAVDKVADDVKKAAAQGAEAFLKGMQSPFNPVKDDE